MWQGEDVVRQSGVPFAVMRPCALTEEPAGAGLQLSQGDNIKVSFMPTCLQQQGWQEAADAWQMLLTCILGGLRIGLHHLIAA